MGGSGYMIAKLSLWPIGPTNDLCKIINFMSCTYIIFIKQMAVFLKWQVSTIATQCIMHMIIVSQMSGDLFFFLFINTVIY